MKKSSEDVLDYAETIHTAMRLVPRDLRQAVLAEEARLTAVDEANQGPLSLGELEKLYPSRSDEGTMRIRSQLVLLFTRQITNNRSNADADKILFQQHRGPGSGQLLDYLTGLPSLIKRGMRAHD